MQRMTLSLICIFKLERGAGVLSIKSLENTAQGESLFVLRQPLGFLKADRALGVEPAVCLGQARTER